MRKASTTLSWSEDNPLASMLGVLRETITPEALSLAWEAAQLVLEISSDVSLAKACLLDSLSSQAEAAPVMTSALRAVAGESALQQAQALRRFGPMPAAADEIGSADQSPDQAETLRKMLLAVIGDPRLVVVRLTQQLVYARHSRRWPKAQRQNLARANLELYAPLANRLGISRLKWELEDLAFRELEPATYLSLAKALSETREQREGYIAKALQTLDAALREASIPAQTYGRPKHLYSIHLKTQRKGLTLAQVFDIRAVRIVVESVTDCYAALGLVHGLWPILSREFDDYIAAPKTNDYQSIHTAVQGPDGKSLEVQIRTQAMQAQAELGVAAHWQYKEGGKGAASYAEKIRQVRQLLSSSTESDAPPDDLRRLATGLFEDRVYALTPKGEVVDLPQRGTPLDFAFHLHSGLGERCRGAKINGRIVPLNHQLVSGDMVEILTHKQPAPSRDWLRSKDGYLASTRARAKLRAYFRRIDEAENSSTTDPIRQAANDPPQLAARAKSKAISSTQRVKGRGKSRSPVAIEGVGDLPITLARCCAPVRPQAIRGYLTLGRGVTIHLSSCAALARMLKGKPQRALQVDWASDHEQKMSATLLVQALDRRGLLRDISDLIASEHLSIDGVSSHTDADRVAHFEVRLSVNDVTELTRLQRQLARIPNVLRVRRG